ncbi:MAG: helix-turn-helix transcriptional regulator [Clostridiales bacterium]|nr:helix-turn-helix transcriptional regulator [Clostridiales bacterium]
MITEFGKLLKIIRINSGDSSKEMASKLNLSPSYLSAIENGKRSIPMDMDSQIMKAYPISETDSDRLHKAMFESSSTVKINLTDFAEKKRRLIFSLARNDVPDETLDKIFNLVYSSEKDT